MGVRWNLPAHVAFQTSFHRLQVLPRRHPRSRRSRRFASSLEPVDTAGRLGSSQLSSDPSSSVAKTAWCQVAQLEEGRFHTVPRREKWLKVFLFSAACICLWKLLEFRSIVRIVKLSYELELICMGFRWNVYLHFVLVPTCFRQIDSHKTQQVLRQWPPRSRWSRRFA